MPAAPGCRFEVVADIARRRYRLAVHIEDHVAWLDALLGGRALGVDADHGDTFRAGAGHLGGRRERQSKPGLALTSRGGFWGRLARNRGDRKPECLLLTVAPDLKADVLAWVPGRDISGKIARTDNRRAVERQDDVTGLQPRSRRRSAALNLVDEGTLGLLEAQT